MRGREKVNDGRVDTRDWERKKKRRRRGMLRVSRKKGSKRRKKGKQIICDKSNRKIQRA